MHAGYTAPVAGAGASASSDGITPNSASSP